MALDADLQEDAEQVLDEMGANSEIYCATFDSATNTFVHPTALTNNTTADMMPQFSESDSDLAVTWVRNSESDFMQESGTNAVYQRVWNGTAFGAEEKLCETEQAISRYASLTSGTDTEVFYVAKADEEDPKLYNSSGEVVSAMEQTEDVIEDITFIRAKDEKVTYVSNGTLYEYGITSGETVTYQAGESAFGSALQYCANGDKEGYIWSIYDEDTMQGTIMASMKTEEGYSEPVTLFEGANTMYRHIYPSLSANGEWSIIANAQDVETNLNSLVYLTKEEDLLLPCTCL